MTVTMTLHIEPTSCTLGYRDLDSTIEISLACSPISLMRDEFTSDPPRPYELTNAIGLVIDELDDALRDMPDLGFDTHFVGTGPLLFTAAAIEVGTRDIAQWPPHACTKDQLEDVFRTVVTEARSDRQHNPGLPSDEIDVIVGAMCIVVAFMRHLSIARLTIS
jgi:exopolyphosphatase/pppGpp-phosphohydrolase